MSPTAAVFIRFPYVPPTRNELSSKQRRTHITHPHDARTVFPFTSPIEGRISRARTHGATPTSAPALSMLSSVTSSSEDTVLNKSLVDFADGLSYPRVLPTSEQVFTTVHSEFGHCGNEDYRYTSQHRAGTLYKSIPEQDPPYYILLTAYISYILVICLGHVHDFVGKRFWAADYRHLLPWNVSARLSCVLITMSRAGEHIRVTGVCGVELGFRLVLHASSQAPHRRLLLPAHHWCPRTHHRPP